MPVLTIRVTTRAEVYELRKRQHCDAGYHIEDEQPQPVNGLCSFTAIRIIPDTDDPGTGVR
jgi:hypothetical protein